MTSPLIIVGTPRSCSTLSLHVVRSLYRCNGFRVEPQLEPFANSAYFGPDRVSDRYPTTDIKSEHAYFQKVREIQARAAAFAEEASSPSKLVIVDMSFHLVSLLDKAWGRNFLMDSTLVFVTRDPDLAVPSYLRPNHWPDATREEFGYHFLDRIFEEVFAEKGKKPFFYDGTDLQRQPDLVLSALARHLGLRFYAEAKDYTPDLHRGYREFPGFYTEIIGSTSIHPPQPKPEDDNIRQTQRAQAEIEFAMPYYEKWRPFFS